MATLSAAKPFSLVMVLLELSLLLQPATPAAQFLQWSPPSQTSQTRTRAVKDPWPDAGILDSRASSSLATPDPWTTSTADPWKNSGSGLNSRVNPTGSTPDPWTTTTADPWKNSGSGVNSRVNPTGSPPDPWTRPTTTTTTPDPWTKPTSIASRTNPTTIPTTTPDPWTPTTPDFETIDTINVISSNYFSRQPDTGRLGGGAAAGSTADCQRALDQCSLFGVEPAALDNVYQQAFATMLQKQRLSHQANLRKARDLFINLFNQFLINPDTFTDSQPCVGASAPVLLQNDPANTLADARNIQDVNVPPLEQCVVSEWSEWSLPLAFGIVERSRSILKPGQCCPGPDELVEQVNITSYLNQNNNAFENPNNVAGNFNNDFLNNEPRDILLVIDTSSSIYVDDFEVMKEGIKTMIELFCGSFGYGENQNRLAILQFSNSPVVIHYFSDPQTPAELKAKVDKMVDFGGKTCTGDALVKAHDEIFTVENGARAYMPNDTLIVTDGHANCGANLLESAKLLSTRSKSIYSLGIGIAGDVTARAQVTSLVTNQDPHHIFSLARYMDFKEMIDYIKYRQDGQTCTPILAEKTSNGGY